MRVSHVMAAVLGLVGVARMAGAQVTDTRCTGNLARGSGIPCSFQNVLPATIPAIARLQLSQSSTPLATPRASSFGGYVPTDGPVLSVQANVPIHVTVRALSSTFTPGAGATYQKPASDLEFRTAMPGASTFPSGFATSTGSQTSAFSPMSTTGQTVLSSSTATAGLSTSVQFQTKYLYNKDAPGTYTLTLAYTLAAP